jgi:glutamyl-tRNA reductase
VIAVLKSMAAKHKASRGSQHFRAKATNRVDDLQGMVSELQQARRQNRLKDVALLEEQMHQMLREWKAELREASPASSLLAEPSSSELSSDMERLLQLNNEDDDASSIALTPSPTTNLPLEAAGTSTSQKVLTLLGLY